MGYLCAMIVVTGAAGFIGSAFAGWLNRHGYNDLVLVDDFSRPEKHPNLQGKQFSEKVGRDAFAAWLDKNHLRVQCVYHLGARTDTAEFDAALLARLNTEYTQAVWQQCVRYGIPLIYASSAATYGAGELGYSDSHGIVPRLRPLNPYGDSKNEFDQWALAQPEKPGYWAGLKFFNVYGPNEYHKGRMASVVFHAFHQIRETGRMKLFRSHRPGVADGMQMRDFVHIKDVCRVLLWLMEHRNPQNSGIYNLGTGRAEPFLALAEAVFQAMGTPPQIEYIDMPADIRDKYQYFTQAEMGKLRSAGYAEPFAPLAEGAADYVREYLAKSRYL